MSGRCETKGMDMVECEIRRHRVRASTDEKDQSRPCAQSDLIYCTVLLQLKQAGCCVYPGLSWNPNDVIGVEWL